LTNARVRQGRRINHHGAAFGLFQRQRISRSRVTQLDLFKEERFGMRKPATVAFNAQDFLEKVGVGKTILEFGKNQNVFTQGDVANTVFYIQTGKVKRTVISKLDKEAVVGVLRPGQFFGEGCMNGHPLRIATTTAMEHCVITSITKQAMQATLHDQPAFAELRGVSSDPEQPD
jgi:CRP-like cAMP-binding protein